MVFVAKNQVLSQSDALQGILYRYCAIATALFVVLRRPLLY